MRKTDISTKRHSEKIRDKLCSAKYGMKHAIFIKIGNDDICAEVTFSRKIDYRRHGNSQDASALSEGKSKFHSCGLGLHLPRSK